MQCPAPHDLAAYLDGDLGPGELDDLESHLDLCSSCRTIVVSLVAAPANGSSPAEDVDPQPFVAAGTQVGRYVIADWLGSGGMGTVYRGHDPELDRSVAIKLLRHEQRRGDGERAQEHMRREARAMARVSHPNVVGVFDVGRHGDALFLAMELVEGIPLSTWLRVEQRSPDHVLSAFVRAGSGLAVAHDAGIVHRDFKPGNVLVGPAEQVRVTDFGLARMLFDDDSCAGERAPVGPSGDAQSTVTGDVAGTPAYMAPEQRDGKPADARGDQYSFCLAVAEALTVTPHSPDIVPDRDSVLARLDANRAVPARARDAIRRGLAADPQQRHPDMRALLTELRPPSPRRARSLAVAAVAALLGITGVAIAATGAGSEEPSCAVPANKFDGVWTAEIARRLPWPDVVPAVSDYVEQWRAMYTEACQATHVHREQSRELLDLRMACLEVRRHGLGGVVELVDDPGLERGTVDRLVGSLPPLSGCANVGSLRKRMPLPEQPDRRARVVKMHGELQRAYAVALTGDLAAALSRTAEVVSAGRELEFSLLTGQALLVQGSFAWRLGRMDEAEVLLTEAYATAETARDDDTRVDALLQLGAIAAQRARYDEALRLARVASAAASHLPDGDSRTAAIENLIGSVHMERGDNEPALVHLTRALNIAENTLPPEHPNLLGSRRNVANLLRRLGRFDEALTHYIEIVERSEGDSPWAASSRGELGNLFIEVGRVAEAEQHLREARAIRERTLPPGHPGLARSRVDLGYWHLRVDDPESARREFEAALAIVSPKDGRELPTAAALVANANEGLGHALLELGESRQAIPPLEASLRAAAELDTGHPANTRFALARALWQSRADRARAIVLARRAHADFGARVEPAAATERQRVARWLRERGLEQL